MVSIALAVQCAASSPGEWIEPGEKARAKCCFASKSNFHFRVHSVHCDGSPTSAGLTDFTMGLLLLLMVVLGAVGEEEGGLAHLQWTPVADRSVSYRVIFFTGTPLKSTEKLIWARLGVSRPIYVNVDSPNLGFTYFNFLGGTRETKHFRVTQTDRQTDRHTAPVIYKSSSS